MLVLTRKLGEKIIIGSETSIEVVEIRGNKVRLGVTAPKHVVVDREEISHARRAAEAAGLAR